MQKGSGPGTFHERSPGKVPVYKSTSDMPGTLAPPVAFGIVAPCVYRSDLPTEVNFEFLRELGLRSAVYLSPDIPTRSIRQFLASPLVRIHGVKPTPRFIQKIRGRREFEILCKHVHFGAFFHI